MSEFTEMQIFFAVTTIAVVLVAAVIVVGIMRIVRILGYVERIAKMAADEGALVRGDIMELRGRLKEEGLKLGALTTFFRSQVEKMAGKRTVRKSKVTNTTNTNESAYEKNESEDELQ
jgi:hypothetical protein